MSIFLFFPMHGLFWADLPPKESYQTAVSLFLLELFLDWKMPAEGLNNYTYKSR
jgi:hypothetical protein